MLYMCFDYMEQSRLLIRHLHGLWSTIESTCISGLQPLVNVSENSFFLYIFKITFFLVGITDQVIGPGPGIDQKW